MPENEIHAAWLCGLWCLLPMILTVLLFLSSISHTFRANKSTKLIYRNRNPKNGPFLESIDLVFGRVYVSWGDGSILRYLVKLAHRSWNV